MAKGSSSNKGGGGGGLKDPFGKWDDNSTRGVARLAQNIQTARTETRTATARVASLKQQLESASGPEARYLKGLLKQAVEDLGKTASSQAQMAEAVRDMQEMRREVVGKIAALRSWQLNEGETARPLEKRKTQAVKKNLEKVLQDLSQKDLSQVNFTKLAATMDKIQIQQNALPPDLAARFAATEDVLENIRSRQDEAKKFLMENRQMLKGIGRDILGRIGQLSMGLADRIGVGPFTLGNAVRGAAVLGRGALATARFATRFAKGETYGQRYLRARSDAKGGSSFNQQMVEALEKAGVENSWFHRKLIRELEKQGRDRKNGERGGLLGTIGSALSSITEGLSKFFGSGGFLKSISAIGRWLGPLAVGARFLMTRAMPVIGAFLGGWKIGSAIYDAYAVQIQDAIDKTIGALSSAYDWVKSKIGGAVDTAKSFVSSATGTIADKAKEVYGSAMSVASRIGNMVMGTAEASVPTTPSVSGAASSSTGGVGSVTGAGVSNINSLVGPVITKGSGNVDLNGLTPEMQAAVGGMAQEYFQATGKKLQINSGARSNELQAKLYKTMPAGMAAPPGSSLHNYGLAVDVQASQANEMQRMGLLQKYGFVRPIRNEPWHMQPAGASVAAAKAGIFSADAPINQSTRVAASATPQAAAPVPTAAPSMGNTQTPAVGSVANSGLGGTAVAGSKAVGLNDIPTHDMSDGLLVALNLGVIG